jgi:1,4-alpha-glucan branching enzyme
MNDLMNITKAMMGSSGRYSAKKMAKPVNFHCHAPGARYVTLLGDFNQWTPNVHSMQRQADGSWYRQVELTHGHHRYVFLVDGKLVLDPRAQGTSYNDRNEKVSIVAVS